MIHYRHDLSSVTIKLFPLEMGNDLLHLPVPFFFWKAWNFSVISVVWPFANNHSWHLFSTFCSSCLYLYHMKQKCQANKISGIYKIINKVNGKYYVGSTTQLYTSRSRWNNHKQALIRGNHRNSHLQNAWNKYGPDAFEFIIIEKCWQHDVTFLHEESRER